MASVGFGSDEEQGLIGDGVPIEQAPNAEQEADDIHQMKLRYCLPKTADRRPFVLTTNQAMKFDFTGEKLNSFVISVVKGGVVRVYIGDQSSNSGHAPLAPDFMLDGSIAGGSQQFGLPPTDTLILTVQDDAAGSTGTLIGLAL